MMQSCDCFAGYMGLLLFSVWRSERICDVPLPDCVRLSFTEQTAGTAGGLRQFQWISPWEI